MTTLEMADKIVDCVKLKGNTSFVEIMNALGDEAKGEYDWELMPNLVLWSGVSEQFCDALQETKDRIEPRATTVLVYFYDGVTLRLPIAKNPPRNGYKKPHWLPVVFNARNAPPL